MSATQFDHHIGFSVLSNVENKQYVTILASQAEMRIEMDGELEGLQKRLDSSDRYNK